MIHNPAQKGPLWLAFTRVALASVLLVLGARFTIVLPFSPVPITGQTLAVMVLALSLGAKEAFASVALYLFQGLAGLPVFASPLAGPAAFVAPTAGYLLGMLPASAIIGWFADRGCQRSFGKTLGALLLGLAVLYGFGLAWLSVFIPAPGLLAAGLLPFLPGEALKILAAAGLLPALGRFFSR